VGAALPAPQPDAAKALVNYLCGARGGSQHQEGRRKQKKAKASCRSFDIFRDLPIYRGLAVHFRGLPGIGGTRRAECQMMQQTVRVTGNDRVGVTGPMATRHLSSAGGLGEPPVIAALAEAQDPIGVSITSEASPTGEERFTGDRVSIRDSRPQPVTNLDHAARLACALGTGPTLVLPVVSGQDSGALRTKKEPMRARFAYATVLS
jgi:hypothetical protein